MTKDNATPRPWRLYAPDRPLKEFIDVCIEKSPDHQNYEARIITNIDNANDPEYRILCILGNGPKADANARLIVKAVNCHDELVKLLKIVESVMANNEPMLNAIAKAIGEENACNLQDDITEALSKAESEA